MNVRGILDLPILIFSGPTPDVDVNSDFLVTFVNLNDVDNYGGNNDGDK